MNSNIQKHVRAEVLNLLNTLSSIFNGDELAFYSLQAKNEVQIRDRIAWELQKRLDSIYQNTGNQFIVRREWSPNPKKVKLLPPAGSKNNATNARSKVDMAILEVNMQDPTHNDVEVVALFEFKAHSFVNQEKWPYAEFLMDVKKMYDIVNGLNNDPKKAYGSLANEIDMYFIFLHSTQNQRQLTGGYGEAVAYVNILNNNRTIVSAQPADFSNYWRGFYDDSNIYLQFFNKKQPPLLYQQYDSFDKTAKLTPYKAPTPNSNFLIHYPNGITPVPNQPNIQLVGTYLTYDWYVAPFIWGPYKIDLQVNTNCLINVK